MHLVIIPGNSKQYNEEWLYTSQKHFKDLFESVTTHYYKHWKEGTEDIDIEHEVNALAKKVSKLAGDYVIYAKSAGTVVTIKAVVDGKVAPSKCIFVGSPFGWAKKEDQRFDKYFTNYDVDTLFIQQTDDPFFAHKDLEEFLDKSNVKDYRLVEVDGNNHAYDNYSKIKTMLKDFLAL